MEKILRSRAAALSVCGFSLLAIGTPGLAADSTDFQYPELSVTPRASERLEREAQHEGASAWTNLIPFYVSGAVTLSAGVVQLNNYSLTRDSDGRSGYAGIAVGGAWLVGMAVTAATYFPYVAGAADIAPMPSKTEREQLYRERLAEEDLDAPARLIKRLAWISTISNLATNAYMLSQAAGGSISIPADIVGLAASLTPLIFQSYWVEVAREQNDYKKRIFGSWAPVASAAFVEAPGTSKLAPEMTVSFLF